MLSYNSSVFACYYLYSTITCTQVFHILYNKIYFAFIFLAISKNPSVTMEQVTPPPVPCTAPHVLFYPPISPIHSLIHSLHPPRSLTPLSSPCFDFFIISFSLFVIRPTSFLPRYKFSVHYFHNSFISSIPPSHNIISYSFHSSSSSIKLLPQSLFHLHTSRQVGLCLLANSVMSASS